MTKAQLNAALRRSVPILLVATAVAIGVATRVHFLRHEMMSRWRGTLDGGALTTQATVDEWFTERTAEAEALAASVAIHAAFNHVGDPSPPFLTVLAPIVRGRKFTEGWGVIRRVSYGDALVPLDTEMSIEGAFLLAVLALGGLGAYGANRTVRVRRLYAQHEATVRLSTVVDAMCLADVVAATVRAMAPAIAESGVQVRVADQSRGAFVLADRAGIEQIVTNVVSNAVQASGRDDVVSVTTRCGNDACELVVGGLGRRDFGGGATPNLRSLLHDQADGRGDGSRLVRDAGNRGAARRSNCGNTAYGRDRIAIRGHASASSPGHARGSGA
jgi:hypothetical protein